VSCDSRPFRFDLVAHVRDSDPHSVRERTKIDPMIVAIRFDEPDSFLDALDSRPPLSRLCVMNPDAELQKDADEVGFIAHSLEKEILEQVAGFEILAVVEQRNAANESWIGGDVHVGRVRYEKNAVQVNRVKAGASLETCSTQ
jgi:hypothetical protein